MSQPKRYTLEPAKGQAILRFEGRRMPDSVELFETSVIEEVRAKYDNKLIKDKQTDLNSDFRNLLVHGDCLSACAYLKSKNIKIDLVYIDPPFASGANYAKEIYLRTDGKEALKDDQIAIGEEIMYGDIWAKEDYLNWLYERLLAIRDVMSETASIYLHLDWHIGHYAKILMDEVFGEENFRNEIVWAYSGSGQSDVQFKRKHDTILFYSKSDINNFNWYDVALELNEKQKAKFSGQDEKGKYKEYQQNGKIYKQYLSEDSKLKLTDVWTDIYIIQSWDEKLDYATQKPEALLERIIQASSNNGMIVADFFSGSGTTAKVANDLGRKFVVCDIGINAIQTTRDRLVEAGAEFDILKVNDGIRLFRNPAQTTAKLFSLIDGFKSRTELELSDFWDGGIAESTGSYVPVKFIGIQERLTKELLDVILEEIYQIEDTTNNADGVKIIYAYKDLDIDQSYINKEVKKAGKTSMKVELVSLQDLLGNKSDVLFNPDCADIEVTKDGNSWKVEIKKFWSHYLKNKVEDFNAKRNLIDGKKAIAISENGLELIESVQFDTKLLKDVWTSDLSLEDKAGIKDKIKGVYKLKTDKFKIKIRNIAGDEIIFDHT